MKAENTTENKLENKAGNSSEPAEEAKRPAVQEAAEDVDYEELVTYEAPLLGTGERSDVLVSVNGETIRFQRGEPVRIKRKFVEALKNAERQERAARAARENARKKSTRPITEM